MKWIKIDPDNLPKGEVLAASFQEEIFVQRKGNIANPYHKQKSIGTLHNAQNQIICMGNSMQTLFHATHYIDINQIELP